jgi:hypothetical protein
VNRSKQKGTSAETTVVRWARGSGYWPEAARIVLHGREDHGDVRLNSWTMLQVKAGRAAEKASDAQIHAWLVQTQQQARAGGFSEGFLVTKRAGIGLTRPDAWWCHAMFNDDHEDEGPYPIRFLLRYLPHHLGELRAYPAPVATGGM